MPLQVGAAKGGWRGEVLDAQDGRLTHVPRVDVDECVLFGPHACMGGVCVNKVPGYACYCPSGYYYEREQLECVGETPNPDPDPTCWHG